MANAENTGSNAVWAIVVLVLVGVIVWLLTVGPLSGGRGTDGSADIEVDIEMPSTPPGGQ